MNYEDPEEEFIQELIGRELNGFRVTEQLGEGGMAFVLRAENIVDPTICRALKIIRPRYMERDLFFQRFAREARVLEKLQHPNIIRFHGLRKIRQLLMMELEFLDGRSLADPVFEGRAFTLPRVLDWIGQAAEGIAFAHQHEVLHRDLKPANLFLTREGVLKVLDFGVAKVLDELEEARSGTLNGHVLGSPAYMAPEVCQGQRPSPAADVYALGLVFYQLLLGRHPLLGEEIEQRTAMQIMLTHLQRTPPPLRRIIPDAPKGLERVLSRAVAREVDERYPDAGAFWQALYPWVESLAQRPAPTFTMLPRPLTPPPSEAPAPKQSLSSLLLFPLLLLLGWGLGQIDSASLRGEVWSMIDPEGPADPTPAPIDLGELQWVQVQPKNGPPFELTLSEVTVAQYARCVDAGACELPSGEIAYGRCIWSAHSDGSASAPPPLGLTVPMNCVTYVDALRFAEWAGARLPSEKEWRLAAHGHDARVFPWGDQAASCHYAVLFEGGPACDLPPLSEALGVGPQPVCSRPRGLSEDGICDLVGNVWEWLYSEEIGEERVIGGGWYSEGRPLKKLRADRRLRNHKDAALGIRLARDL
ncbi:MAG: bifunctional serine/threonine-protein kinase/formylglycine-generating enzyme family protein [Myxococcota bacterium]|nr:bifunctional serine/threonine-protein kinase/formylglycine-generating enzyme family protein [Myxococcota bacterium]